MINSLETTNFGFIGRFQAMASPCECLIEASSEIDARKIFHLVFNEAKRIEDKFSRYQKGNICYQINSSNNTPVRIDQETFNLLKFANTCFELSDGLFDITSGVLRKAWKFKPNATFPSQNDIDVLLPFIGWKEVKFDENSIQLKPNMEIDFGGIGKEYAVDRAAQLVNDSFPDTSVLINFGGDLRVTCKPKFKPAWQIGVDCEGPTIKRAVSMKVGSLATSGDSERFIMHQGKRYSHLLNPKTGWPITDAPHSVSVISDQCLQAGLLSTLAMLNGKNAENFLQQQNVEFYCQR